MWNIQNKKGGVALLSGGLDSTVAFLVGVKKGYVDLAITFNYGQVAFTKEEKSANFFANVLGVKHLTIVLPFLKKISWKSGLVRGTVPQPSTLSQREAIRTAQEVWIPNRNALFINVAASFCDAYGKKWIVTGFNREEGSTFPDNSEEFVHRINKTLRFSTLVKPRVWVPLIRFTKSEILKKALRMKVPLEKIWVCYGSGEKHCGKCESCVRLKRAMKDVGILNDYKGMFEC